MANIVNRIVIYGSAKYFKQGQEFKLLRSLAITLETLLVDWPVFNEIPAKTKQYDSF